jgi:hypothetical protein
MAHGEYVAGKANDTVIGYCVRCRAKRTVVAPQTVTLKTNRPAKRGYCSYCKENGKSTLIYVTVKKDS